MQPCKILTLRKILADNIAGAFFNTSITYESRNISDPPHVVRIWDSPYAKQQTYTVDTLSRAPRNQSTVADIDLDEKIKVYVHDIMTTIPARGQQMEQIRLSALQDDEYRKSVQYCDDGWPEKGTINRVLKAYYPYKNIADSRRYHYVGITGWWI